MSVLYIPPLLRDSGAPLTHMNMTRLKALLSRCTQKLKGYLHTPQKAGIYSLSTHQKSATDTRTPDNVFKSTLMRLDQLHF